MKLDLTSKKQIQIKVKLMKNLIGKELIRLGKKHKKWTELVSMNNFPYLVNNKRYYLAYYFGRFNTEVTSCAVVSPDSGTNEDSKRAFKPLVYFSISLGNIDVTVTTRAKLTYVSWLEIRNYLNSILEDNVLDSSLIVYYKRSLDIINEMIKQQEEMVSMKEKHDHFVKSLYERGYFIDSDIDYVLQIVPTLDRLQYFQFVKRYKHRHDFDVIYENRNNSDLQKYMRCFSDKQTLYNMTSRIAEKTIKETLDLLSFGVDLSQSTGEEYQEFIYSKYKRNLEEKVKEMARISKYPNFNN
jgi:hypothetical protein